MTTPCAASGPARPGTSAPRAARLSLTVTLTVTATLLAAGCSTLSQIPDVDLAKVPAVPVPVATAPAPATGGLYSTGSFRPGFEDHRARLIGDTLTVQIVEQLSASQTTSSTANRESELSTSASALPFARSKVLNPLSASAKSSNTFSGDGATTSANTFSGSITATVADVLPNGHLVVIGEKQIGVNQNVDVLRFSGTVDPRTIQPGNAVNSTQIANVRVLSRGRGAQNDAQTFGWLSRFFLTLLPF